MKKSDSSLLAHVNQALDLSAFAVDMLSGMIGPWLGDLLNAYRTPIDYDEITSRLVHPL